MRTSWLIRLALVAALAAVLGWVVHETRWVEITVDEDERGEAATDKHYALRRVLQAGGATLEVRTALEPLPPPGATLLLDSSFWNIFPGRSERLKAWVENGGHLVVQGMHDNADKQLRWLPISFRMPRAASAPGDVVGATLPPARAAREPASSASAPGDVVGATLPAAKDDEDEDADIGPDGKPVREQPFDHPFKTQRGRNWGGCRTYVEAPETTAPAFPPRRAYRGCTGIDSMRTLKGAVPTWKLVDRKQRVLALRLPYGRGSVTGVSFVADLGNRPLLQADNALIASAILQAEPGRAIWIVEDESREALPLWMWHEARTPTLLIAIAIVLSLWRLLPRFGPRAAPPPQGRRSMGEQVSGTGQFIASADPRALHAATRAAFEAVGRTRIDGWAGHDDAGRVAALAAALAPATTLAQSALLAALDPAPAATPAQILAAIAVIEQARRALLRAPVSPFAN